MGKRITNEEHAADGASQIGEIVDSLTDATLNGTDQWSMGLRAAMLGGALKGGDLHPFTRRNQVVLTLLGMARGYTSRTWFTSKQARAAGFPLDWDAAQGRHATVFLPLFRKDEQTGEQAFKGYRAYRVYNGDHCPGWADPAIEDFTPHADPEAAELALVGLWGGVTHTGAAAFYTPPWDTVTLPPRDAFESIQRYLGTLCHERIHQSGHRTRMEREGVCNPAIFGDHRYAAEELIAESGAAVMLGMLGIESDAAHHGAYLRSWLKRAGNTPEALAKGLADGVEAARYTLKAAGLLPA